MLLYPTFIFYAHEEISDCLNIDWPFLLFYTYKNHMDGHRRFHNVLERTPK